MEHSISHSMGTHIDWKHEGVMAREIDWFWSNMEKGFILWHRNSTKRSDGAVPPKHESNRLDPHCPCKLE